MIVRAKKKQLPKERVDEIDRVASCLPEEFIAVFVKYWDDDVGELPSEAGAIKIGDISVVERWNDSTIRITMSSGEQFQIEGNLEGFLEAVTKGWAIYHI